MHTASKLKHYGYVHFDPCICDYPCTNTAANVVVGNRELILRIRSPTLGEKTGFFKVTKMRCWRIMTVSRRQQGFESSVVTDGAAEEAEEAGEPPSNVDLELSFEYLMHSGELQWITIVSRQAILMSLCLQSMVEELLRERNGVPIKKVSADRSLTCRIILGKNTYCFRLAKGLVASTTLSSAATAPSRTFPSAHARNR